MNNIEELIIDKVYFLPKNSNIWNIRIQSDIITTDDYYFKVTQKTYDNIKCFGFIVDKTNMLIKNKIFGECKININQLQNIK